MVAEDCASSFPVFPLLLSVCSLTCLFLALRLRLQTTRRREILRAVCGCGTRKAAITRVVGTGGVDVFPIRIIDFKSVSLLPLGACSILPQVRDGCGRVACSNTNCSANKGAPTVRTPSVSFALQPHTHDKLKKKNRCSTSPMFTYVIGTKLPMFI